MNLPPATSLQRPDDESGTHEDELTYPRPATQAPSPSPEEPVSGEAGGVAVMLEVPLRLLAVSLEVPLRLLAMMLHLPQASHTAPSPSPEEPISGEAGGVATHVMD